MYGEDIIPELNLIDKIHNQSGIPTKDILYNYKKWLAEIKNENGGYTIPRVGEVVEDNGTKKFIINNELGSLMNQDIPDDESEKDIAENENVTVVQEIPPKKNNSAKLIFALLLLAAIGVGGYYYFNGETKLLQIEKETTPVSPVEKEQEKTDTLQKNIDIVANTGPMFHVIGGVFSVKENAERFIENLGVKTNYDPIIIPKGDTYMVSLMRFSNREDAVTEVRKVPSVDREIWIYEQK